MISKKFICALALAAAPSLVAVGFAQAGPPNGGGHHEFFHGPMPMLIGVDLTKQQKKQLHDIFKDHRGEMRAQWQQEREIDRQISALLLSDGAVDKAKLAALFKQKDMLHEHDDQGMIDDAVKVHDILTPEQRAKARATQEKLESLHEQIEELVKPPHGDESEPTP